MSEPARVHPLTDRFLARLRRAGALLLTGMAVEVGTLVSSSPAAFLVFALAGVSLVLAGIVLYLLALLSRDGALERRAETPCPEPAAPPAAPDAPDA